MMTRIITRNGAEVYTAAQVRYTNRMKTAFSEPEIVTRKGKPVSVILPIKDYEALLERLEDAEDIAYLKKARKKPMHYRPLDDVLAHLARK